VKRKSRKHYEEYFFIACMWCAFGVMVAVLLLLVGSVVVKGVSVMNLDMITKTASGGFYLGREGGVLHAIAGSFLVAGGASLLALVFSVPIVILMNVYLSSHARLARVTRFFMDVLCGVPSIVCGVFCFAVMMSLGIRASSFGGIIAIAILITPVMTRALDEVARGVPRELLMTAFALGSTRFEAGFRVFLRQIIPGLVTAFLLAFGRGIGDAAAVLFTAGFTDNMPTSLFKPAATLPLAIFFQLEMPLEEVRNRAFASALILLVIILSVSILARVAAARYRKFKV
jgi:phosphate transport system permease protein